MYLYIELMMEKDMQKKIGDFKKKVNQMNFIVIILMVNMEIIMIIIILVYMKIIINVDYHSFSPF